VHSCIASHGACTPFVSDTPGLATHTSAHKGNFSDGSVTFASTVKLPEDQYTIIAHVRFFTKAEIEGLPSTQWDVAIGALRDVVVKNFTDTGVGHCAPVSAGKSRFRS